MYTYKKQPLTPPFQFSYRFFFNLSTVLCRTSLSLSLSIFSAVVPALWTVPLCRESAVLRKEISVANYKRNKKIYCPFNDVRLTYVLNRTQMNIYSENLIFLFA